MEISLFAIRSNIFRHAIIVRFSVCNLRRRRRYRRCRRRRRARARGCCCHHPPSSFCLVTTIPTTNLLADSLLPTGARVYCDDPRIANPSQRLWRVVVVVVCCCLLLLFLLLLPTLQPIVASISPLHQPHRLIVAFRYR